MSSLVIDTCVMTLYDTPMDPTYKELFQWISQQGTLVVSHHLLNEYNRSGNLKISLLLEKLMRHDENIRLVKISNEDINNFKEDTKFKYQCNKEDINNARLVFISSRKKIVTHDIKLTNDINKFKKINGIKPEAQKKPAPEFYK